LKLGAAKFGFKLADKTPGFRKGLPQDSGSITSLVESNSTSPIRLLIGWGFGHVTLESQFKSETSNAGGYTSRGAAMRMFGISCCCMFGTLGSSGAARLNFVLI
jgi:hypothetical protein